MKYPLKSTGYDRLALNPNGGNVGIGTTAPQRSLHIAGTSDETAQIRMGQASTYYLDIGYNNSTEYGFLQAYKSTGYDRLALNPNGGNVGIGTTSPDPGYRLTVVGGGLTTEGIWQNSDSRLKKDILPVEGALDKILKLNGVSYEWKHNGKDFEGETAEALKTDDDGNIIDDKYRNLPEGRTLGVIAQELEQVLPEAVNTGEDGIKAVSYTKIIPVLIEAMKEQQKQITDQQKEITKQQKEIEKMKDMISKLK